MYLHPGEAAALSDLRNMDADAFAGAFFLLHFFSVLLRCSSIYSTFGLVDSTA